MHLVLLFGVLLLHATSGQSKPAEISNSKCIAYAANCTNSDLCCYYPSILCLPDAKGGNACLSVLDVVNLSPFLTGSNILSPFFTTLGNSSLAMGAVQEVVKVNGTTVYNYTEIITPSPAVYVTNSTLVNKNV